MTAETIPTHLVHWVLQVCALIATVLFLPKLRLTSLTGAVLMVGALSLVNTFLWSAALFFALPDSLSAQAALLMITNGVIFWILVKLLPGIEIDGIVPALVAPLVFSVSNVLIHTYAPLVDWAGVLAVLWENLQLGFSSLRRFFESSPR